MIKFLKKVWTAILYTMGVIAMATIFSWSIWTLYEPFLRYWHLYPGEVIAWLILCMAGASIPLLVGYVAKITQVLDIDIKKCDVVVYESKYWFFLSFFLSFFLITGMFSSIEIISAGHTSRKDWMVPWFGVLGFALLIERLFSVFNFNCPSLLIYKNGLCYRRLVYFWDKLKWDEIEEVRLITKYYKGKEYTNVIIGISNNRAIKENKWLKWIVNTGRISLNGTNANSTISSKGSQKISQEKIYSKIKQAATKYGYADKIKFYDNGKETSFGLGNII